MLKVGNLKEVENIIRSVFLNWFCVISGFRRDVNEVFALLGCAQHIMAFTDISGQPVVGRKCSETPVTTNLGCVTYQKNEDLKSICQAVSSDSESVSILSAVSYQFVIASSFLPRHFLMFFVGHASVRVSRLPDGSVLFATVRFSRQRSYFRNPAHSPLALI